MNTSRVTPPELPAIAVSADPAKRKLEMIAFNLVNLLIPFLVPLAFIWKSDVLEFGFTKGENFLILFSGPVGLVGIGLHEYGFNDTVAASAAAVARLLTILPFLIRTPRKLSTLVLKTVKNLISSLVIALIGYAFVFIGSQ